MKVREVSLAALAVSVLAVFCPLFVKASAAQVTFQRTYGGSLADCGRCVLETPDGGYLILGYTESFGAGANDIYFIKTDSIGGVEWEKTFGGPLEERAYCLKPTLDGSYVIIGQTESFGAGMEDCHLIKVDSAGNFRWEKAYGGPSHDMGYSIVENSDRGYTIAGASRSFAAGWYGLYLVKTDSLGESSQQMSYGGTLGDYGYSVCEASEKGYAVAGETESFGAGLCDMWVVRVDSLCLLLWSKTYGGASQDRAYSIEPAGDNGFVLAGETYSFGTGGDAWLVRVDSIGDSVWARTYGGSLSETWRCLKSTLDGGYILAGDTRSLGAGAQDVYLAKVDSSGNALWERSFGGASGDRGYWVEATRDGGYVIVGETESFGAGEQDVYLLKTDENGLIGLAEQDGRTRERSELAFLANQPNPFGRAGTSIEFSLGDRQLCFRLSVCDASGRLVRTLIEKNGVAGDEKVGRVFWDGLDRSGREAPSGIYFCRLEGDGFCLVRLMSLVR